MRKCFQALIIILLLVPLISIKAKAESVISINDLIEKAKALDGQEVTVQGEAIGESMNRGDYSWVNINDKTNAIGIWMKKSETAKIMHYGNYDTVGDTIKITGVFHRACKEHGGEADLHCTSLQITLKGNLVKEQISFGKIICAVVLSLAAMFMFYVFIKMNRYKKV